MANTYIITGEHPTRGTLFAAIDPTAHHVAGKIAPRRFGAYLAPFQNEGDARAALAANGCGKVHL